MDNEDCLTSATGGINLDEQKIEQAVTLLLEGLGVKADMAATPQRVASMYRELFSGMDKDTATELETQFVEDFNELVIVKDIFFYSVCEHHLLPFFGKAHVAYIPHGGVVAGLGRLAAVVDSYARRPQLQERLTRQIADLLVDKLQPAGVLVILEAEHLCMTMRGANKPGAQAVTSAARGIFAGDAAARAEAMSLFRK